MEKKSGSQIYILCVPNGNEECLVDLYLCAVDLYLCAPNGKEECLVVLYIVCP